MASLANYTMNRMLTQGAGMYADLKKRKGEKKSDIAGEPPPGKRREKETWG